MNDDDDDSLWSGYFENIITRALLFSTIICFIDANELLIDSFLNAARIQLRSSSNRPNIIV